MPLITSGVVSSPVEFFDVELPAGYDGFRLLIDSLRMGFVDSIIGVFSPDAGSSFFMDTVNFDSYSGNLVQFSVASISGVTEGPSAYMGLTPSMRNGSVGSPANRGAALDLMINPGSASINASVRGESLYSDAADPPQSRMGKCGWYLDDAVGRQNLLRLMPLGNEDNPPTSDETFVFRYHLFGLPAAA